jgi:tetratricopeptide (TPR) repeat protein
MKMLNKYNLTLLTLAVCIATSLTSCRKALFEEPITSLSPESAFETPERIEKAAIGMYDQLQNEEFLGGRALIYADIRGVDASPNAQFGNMFEYNTINSNDLTTGLAYEGAYRTIGEANLFIKNLNAASSIVSPAKASQYTGEAEFIRALTYFYVVNLWAQPYTYTADASHLGVPLVVASSDAPFDASNQLPRSSVAAVYNQIEADLLSAEGKLPPDYNDASFSNVARATKGAAQALLARVYLYKGDYVKANQYADKVIALNKYELNEDPITAFRNFTTKESIFSIAHNGGDNPNTNHSLGQHYAPDKRGDITIRNEFLNLFEQTIDERFLNLITLEDNGSSYSLKYQGTTDWVPVLRYAEVLLIKAEALANISTAVTPDPNAVLLLNEVRDRSNASALAPATKTELIAAILRERRMELAFEGQGIFEFLRTKRDIPAHGNINLKEYGSDYVILPIPRHETDINPNIIQSPGY